MDLTKLSSNEILALTLYGEARGEIIDGQIAVACIIRNRTKSNNYNEVCLAREQLSCWNSNDPNYPILNEMASQLLMGQTIDNIYWVRCLWIAQGIISNYLKDITNGAKYYMTAKLFNSDASPNWAKTSFNRKQFGTQIFFSIKE